MTAQLTFESAPLGTFPEWHFIRDFCRSDQSRARLKLTALIQEHAHTAGRCHQMWGSRAGRQATRAFSGPPTCVLPAGPGAAPSLRFDTAVQAWSWEPGWTPLLLPWPGCVTGTGCWQHAALPCSKSGVLSQVHASMRLVEPGFPCPQELQMDPPPGSQDVPPPAVLPHSILNPTTPHLNGTIHPGSARTLSAL